MIRIPKVILCVSVLCLFAASVVGQKSRDKIEILKPGDYRSPVMLTSPELQTILSKAVGEVIAERSFKPHEMAATLIDVRDPANLKTAEINGELRFYTASVVKMFYMAALHRQLEDAKITLTKEMERGLADMIVDSSNDATGYILDVITDTHGGAELPQKAFESWQYKRNRVNRFFTSLGYRNININQKTFCEDAYGIERQSRNFPTDAANRNMLTTNATARLLAEIATRRFVNEARSNAMLDIMKRDWDTTAKEPNSQAVNFTGKALIDNKMTGTKLWSKSGLAIRSRHDAAYIETPDGLKFVLVVFTENHLNDREPIPSVAAKVIKGLRESK